MFPSYGMGSAASTVGTGVGLSVMKFGTTLGPAAPWVIAGGAVIAAASVIAGALHLGEGCGQTCIDATKIVNQAEPVLVANVNAFKNGELSKSDALHNFDVIWNSIVQACGGIPGAAGQNCVGDRQRNGKWDWFSYYRDPIEFGVDTSVSGTLISELTPSSSNLMVYGLGALVVVGLILASGGNGR